MEQYGIDPALSAALYESVDHDKNRQLDATELAEFLSAARAKSTQLVAEKLAVSSFIVSSYSKQQTQQILSPDSVRSNSNNYTKCLSIV
jgi:hypothetical protein